MPRTRTLSELLVLLLYLDFSYSASDSLFRAFEECPPYSYDDTQPNGPTGWSTLCDSYYACGVGKQQSPIDLITSEAYHNVTPVKIALDYAEPTRRSVRLFNYTTHHTVQVEWYELSTVTSGPFNKAVYTLEEFHFHTPSEHQIDGKRYPLELQFVHYGVTNNLAVLSVMVDYGARNSFIGEWTKYFPISPTCDIHLTKVPSIISFINNAFSDQFYYYTGSLTTPPCTEGVTWVIAKKIITASHEQIEAFANGMGYNARPLQPLHKDRHRLGAYKPTTPVAATSAGKGGWIFFGCGLGVILLVAGTLCIVNRVKKHRSLQQRMELLELAAREASQSRTMLGRAEVAEGPAITEVPSNTARKEIEIELPNVASTSFLEEEVKEQRPTGGTRPTQPQSVS